MSIGQKLRSARLELKQSTSEVAVATRMKVQIVEALENDDFAQMPAVIYAKGFLKLYAEHVGLDPHPLLEEYMARFQAPAHPVFEGLDSTGGNEPQKEESGSENAETEGGGLFDRIRSVFRKQPEYEEASTEEETTQAEPLLKSRSANKTEVLAQHNEIEPQNAEQNLRIPERTVVLPPETEDQPVQEPKPKARRQQSETEPDLFSRLNEPMPEREPEQEIKIEPIHQEPEEQSAPVKPDLSLASALADEAGPEPEDTQLSSDAESDFDEGVGNLKIRCLQWLTGIADKCRESVASVQDACRRFRSELPDLREFEISLKSPAVMIVLVMIFILLVSGLTSLVRRHKAQQNAGNPDVEVRHDRLRIAIEPPAPYYKQE